MNDRIVGHGRIAETYDEVAEGLRLQIRKLCWVSRQFSEPCKNDEPPELDSAITLLVRAEQLVRTLVHD